MAQHYQVLGHLQVYRKTSNVSRTLVGSNIVDHSDVTLSVGIWCALY